jgi:hypothetical protein
MQAATHGWWRQRRQGDFVALNPNVAHRAHVRSEARLCLRALPHARLSGRDCAGIRVENERGGERDRSRESPRPIAARMREQEPPCWRARARAPLTQSRTRFAHTYTSSPHTQNSWPEGVVGLTLKIEKPASCSKNRTPCDDFCLLSYYRVCGTKREGHFT